MVQYISGLTDWDDIVQHAQAIVEEANSSRRPEVVREHVRLVLAGLNGLGITECGPRHHLADTPLTKRENDVLLLSSQGETNEDMAQALHVSPTLIAKASKTLNYKLGAVNRASGVANAFRLGLLS